jgi:hypothetical protein
MVTRVRKCFGAKNKRQYISIYIYTHTHTHIAGKKIHNCSFVNLGLIDENIFVSSCV